MGQHCARMFDWYVEERSFHMVGQCLVLSPLDRMRQLVVSRVAVRAERAREHLLVRCPLALHPKNFLAAERDTKTASGGLHSTGARVALGHLESILRLVTALEGRILLAHH